MRKKDSITQNVCPSVKYSVTLSETNPPHYGVVDGQEEDMGCLAK